MAHHSGSGGEQHGSVRRPNQAEEGLDKAVGDHGRFLPRNCGLFVQPGTRDEGAAQQSQYFYSTQIGGRGFLVLVGKNANVVTNLLCQKIRVYG